MKNKIVIDIQRDTISTLTIRRANKLKDRDDLIAILCNDIEYAYSKIKFPKFGIQYGDNDIYQVEIILGKEIKK